MMEAIKFYANAFVEKLNTICENYESLIIYILTRRQCELVSLLLYIRKKRNKKLSLFISL